MAELRTRWDDFKVGDLVQDTWYPDAGKGEITFKGRGRTRQHLNIHFPGTWGTVIYDRPHATRFLEIMNEKTWKVKIRK